VTGDRIEAVGHGLAAGREEIDLRGLVLAPGFIDIHSHGDGSLEADPRAESVIRQGITTIVAGQDGGGFGDNGFLDGLAAVGPAVNVAAMVGLGTVRGIVLGNADRVPTPAELERMVTLVESALAAGACGASSGLEYTPGGFARTEELIALCRPLSRHGLPYSTHMRNEDDELMPAIDEAIAVARGAGCPLQVSHLKAMGPRNWPAQQSALARLEALANERLPAGFDVYPYVAYQTSLSTMFPLWSREGGVDRFIERLSGPEAARIREETVVKVDLIGGWNHVQISGVSRPEDSSLPGRRLGDAAAEAGQDPYEFAVALIVRNRNSVGMVGYAMSEENVEQLIAHPLSVICSDGGAFALEGPARRGHPHPRGLGAFPRILARYVRERKALSLEDAVRKMSHEPARRVRLAERGRIEPGWFADLVAFDPASVSDRATFAEPFQYPTGIPLVVVNGQVTLRDGERLAMAGRALRPA
jgi:N-acyl-D-amino-acid deacylase